MVQLECRCGPGETAGTHQDEGGKEARRQFPGISSQPACRASGSPGACSCWPGAWVLGAFPTGVVSSRLGSLRTGPGPGRLLPCEGPEVHLQTALPPQERSQLSLLSGTGTRVGQLLQVTLRISLCPLPLSSFSNAGAAAPGQVLGSG